MYVYCKFNISYFFCIINVCLNVWGKKFVSVILECWSYLLEEIMSYVFWKWDY